MHTPFQVSAAIQDLQQRVRALEAMVGVGRQDKGIPPPEKPPPGTPDSKTGTVKGPEQATDAQQLGAMATGPVGTQAKGKATDGPPPSPAVSPPQTETAR